MKTFLTSAQKWVFQIERCPDTGKLHFQWAARWKSQVRMSRLRKELGEGHYQRLGAHEDALAYCSKPESRIAGPWLKGWFVPDPIYDIVAEKGPLEWQKGVLEELALPPTDRKIVWLYDAEGCRGKSALVRHLVLTRKDAVFVTGGRTADIINTINNYMFNEKGEQINNGPKVVLFSYPRGADPEHLHYAGIECIKDGLVTNSKYAARSLVFNPPHVVVLANIQPCWAKMSGDRWDVRDMGILSI